jgi:hypothetical protein
VKLFQVAADESQLTPKPPKLIWAHGLYRFSDYTEKVVRGRSSGEAVSIEAALGRLSTRIFGNAEIIL